MTVPFSKPVKRAALKRAANQCEAVGRMYGLDPGKRCGAALGYGFDFDHIILHANSGDSSLENCAVVCRQCHKHKTTKHDTPMAAKTVRLQDKNAGIKKRSTWPTGRNGPLKRTLDGRTVAR